MANLVLRQTKGSPLTNAEVDGNFTNLNTDKYEAGASPTFTDVTVTGTQKDSNATVTASGTLQADAAAISKTLNIVTGADGTKGVKLPFAAAGLNLTIVNSGTDSLKVYPQTSQSINDLSANAAFIISAKASIQFYAKDASSWSSVTPLVIFSETGTRLN